MNRRDALHAGLFASLAAVLPRNAAAQSSFAPRPDNWRSFEITTRLDLDKAQSAAQAWIPLPAVNEPEWTRPLGNSWSTNARTAVVERDPKYGAQMLHLEWEPAAEPPMAEVTSRFSTRDRAVDLSKFGNAAPLSEAERKLYTEPTALIPTDGIVRRTADMITANATSELAKAKVIYEWIVENTFRNASTRGCGVGDIAAMLRAGNLGGKCADLNALYVGLARAVGLPARDVYGVRVAPSKFGYKSLGTASPAVTKAQHCRAEVYIAGMGWVPVDPADVRKVVLEEPPGNLSLTDPKVVAARKTLFGAWETNWLAYNMAHDIRLPGSTGPAVEFLMYPQAEIAGSRLDSLDPEHFTYVITASEVTPT
ncbi:MAG: transglutaminase domain-containing protein [Xanthobacteraceae bacterium]